MGSKKNVPIVQYPGELGEPHVRVKAAAGFVSLFAGAQKTDEQLEAEAREANLNALRRRLVLLARHYDALKDEEVDWQGLAIGLAFAHVPGFLMVDEMPRRRGRPRSQGLFDFALYEAVLNVLDEGEGSVANACRRLTKRQGAWRGKNAASLESRFHEQRRKAEAMDLTRHLRNPETGFPVGLAGSPFADGTMRPSAKYPPVPFKGLGGLFALGATALGNNEK